MTTTVTTTLTLAEVTALVTHANPTVEPDLVAETAEYTFDELVNGTYHCWVCGTPELRVDCLRPEHWE